MGIIEVQGVHLTLQAAFRSKGLLQLSLQDGDLLFHILCINSRADFRLNRFYKPGIVDHSGYNLSHKLVDLRLLDIQSEAALMSGRCYRVFAVVIIPRFLVLAVSPGDIAVHTLSAAWAFQNAGQDVCMIWIVDLFPLKGIDLTLFLCQIPIFFRNDGFVLSLINRELRLLNYVHLISCALLLFRPASAIGDLSHVNGIVQYILHEVP